MSARCREGHASDGFDYCSVCGAAMGNVAAAPASSNACPSCGEPRADLAARFCEVCRFDFIANRPGPPPAARASAPSPAPAAPLASAPALRWSLVLAIDPSLDVDPDPEAPCPQGTADRMIAVERPELLVGRHDDKRDIHPEVSVHDPGASRRHAKFVRLADGSLALQDLASMNGTKINGADVEAGSRRALRAGDEVTLGRWTRITVRSAP